MESTWEEEIYWKNFHFAHFFLILPHDFHHALMLPKKFTDHMRNQLPEKIVLKVNGISWNVNLVKGKDDVIFQGDGWQEFVKAYSLKNSDVLMFKYDRLECFEVLLFDQASSCEKEASYFVRKGKQSNSNDCDQSSGEAKGVVAEEMTPRNQRVNSAYTFRNQRSKNYDENDDERDETSNEEHANTDKYYTTPKAAYPKRAREVSSISRKRKLELDVKTTSRRKTSRLVRYKSSRRPVTEEEKKNALDKARETCAQYRDSFTVIMRPSSVYSRFYMSIPSEWKMGRFFKKGQEVLLKVKEKTWVCKVVITRFQKGFEGGWKNFVCDNELEEFDVCLFVPTGAKDGKTILDVSIFRVVPEVVRPSPVTPDVRETSRKDINQGDDVSDYAQKNKCVENSGLTSKSRFSGRAANNSELSEDGLDGSFDVDKPITEENSTPLQAVNVIEVPFSSPWNNSNSTPKENGVNGKSSSRQITEADKDRVLEMAKTAAAKHKNSFVQIMKPSTVATHFFMSIPKYWEPRCELKNDEEVILKLSDKTWVCNFSLRPTNTGLRKGWKGFVLDNKLEEFDVCMFVPAEPMNGKSVLDVTIFRVRRDS